MPETSRARTPETDGIHLVPVVRDGFLAGLIGAFVVALAHFAADAGAGSPLRTPMLLGHLLIAGSAAAENARPEVQMAFWFTCIHAGVWICLGMSCSWLISLVDARPGLASLVFGGLGFGFISLLYGAGAFSLPGLPSLHLWLGTFLGAAAAAAYLVRSHPRLAGHLAREHITPTTIGEIRNALADEQAAVAAYEAATARHDHPALAQGLVERRSRRDTLDRLAGEFDLPRPSESELDASSWNTDDLRSTLQSAVDCERRTLALYDRFLFSASEPHVHDVFLRLRFSIADRTVPPLEEALASAG